MCLVMQNGVGIVLGSALDASEILAFPDSEEDVFLLLFALPLFGLGRLSSPTFSGNLLHLSLHQFADKPGLKKKKKKIKRHLLL